MNLRVGGGSGAHGAGGPVESNGPDPQVNKILTPIYRVLSDPASYHSSANGATIAFSKFHDIIKTTLPEIEHYLTNHSENPPSATSCLLQTMDSFFSNIKLLETNDQHHEMPALQPVILSKAIQEYSEGVKPLSADITYVGKDPISPNPKATSVSYTLFPADYLLRAMDRFSESFPGPSYSYSSIDPMGVQAAVFTDNLKEFMKHLHQDGLGELCKQLRQSNSPMDLYFDPDSCIESLANLGLQGTVKITETDQTDPNYHVSYKTYNVVVSGLSSGVFDKLNKYLASDLNDV